MNNKNIINYSYGFLIIFIIFVKFIYLFFKFYSYYLRIKNERNTLKYEKIIKFKDNFEFIFIISISILIIYVYNPYKNTIIDGHIKFILLTYGIVTLITTLIDKYYP